MNINELSSITLFRRRRPRIKVANSSVAVIALRGMTMAARFLLTMYIAKYMGFEALGEYGLIAGAVAIIPTAISFGLINRMVRSAVTASVEETTHALVQCWFFLGLLYLVLGSIACGVAVEQDYLLLVGEIFALALTEHLAGDCFQVLVTIERPVYANTLMFVRSGLSTFAFMVTGTFFSSLNTIPALIGTFAFANLISVVFFFIATAEWPWGQALSSIGIHQLRRGIRNSLVLYSIDVLSVAGQYMDRFLVSLYLGLELTGVYVLFWSVGNALCNLTSTGVILLRRPAIIRAQKERPDLVIPLLRGLIISTFWSSLVLSMFTAVVLYVLLPHLGKPSAVSNISVLWLILTGFVIRMTYEAISVGFYSREQDHLTLFSALLVLTVTCVLNVILIPYFKLNGAALVIIVAFSIGGCFRWYLFLRCDHRGVAPCSDIRERS